MAFTRMKSKSGFGLIETMVSLALLSIGLAVYSQSFTSSTRQIASLDRKSEFANLRQEISSLVGNANACTLNFSGDTGSNPKTISTLQAMASINLAYPIKAGAGWVMPSPQFGADLPYNNITISSMKIDPVSNALAADTKKVTLVLTASLKVGADVTTQTAKIPIYFEVSPGSPDTIIGCRGSQSLSNDDLNQMCNILDMAVDPKTGKCIPDTNDPGQVTSQPVLGQNPRSATCPPGQQVTKCRASIPDSNRDSFAQPRTYVDENGNKVVIPYLPASTKTQMDKSTNSCACMYAADLGASFISQNGTCTAYCQAPATPVSLVPLQQ